MNRSSNIESQGDASDVVFTGKPECRNFRNAYSTRTNIMFLFSVQVDPIGDQCQGRYTIVSEQNGWYVAYLA